MATPVIVLGVLTYNRFGLLKQTMSSLVGTIPATDIVLIDGGSTDPAQLAYVRSWNGECLQIPTVGESMEIVIEHCLRRKADIVVFSADDYQYRSDWQQRLMWFWHRAPADVALASLNWEPDYPWNGVEAIERLGDETVLYRKTLPGSSWSFRAVDWPQIGPIAHKTGGEDFDICQRLRANGKRLAALNLTEHIGERNSAWGNQSWTIAKPLSI